MSQAELRTGPEQLVELVDGPVIVEVVGYIEGEPIEAAPSLSAQELTPVSEAFAQVTAVDIVDFLAQPDPTVDYLAAIAEQQLRLYLASARAAPVVVAPVRLPPTVQHASVLEAKARLS